MINLTPRERIILKLICDEKTNVQIAAKFKFGLRYAEKVRARLYAKARVETGIGLLKWALINNLYALKKKPGKTRK